MTDLEALSMAGNAEATQALILKDVERFGFRMKSQGLICGLEIVADAVGKLRAFATAPPTEPPEETLAVVTKMIEDLHKSLEKSLCDAKAKHERL